MQPSSGRGVGAPARGSVAAAGRGALVVGATFGYFLLFAQFGFLDLLQERLRSAGEVQAAMAAMALAGLAASLATPALCGRWRYGLLVRGGLLASAGSAAVAVGVHSLPLLLVVSAAIGASVGLTTVAVAAGLRTLVPRPARATVIALGTGGAYLASNIPFLFEAEVGAKVAAVIFACLVGAIAAPHSWGATSDSVSAPASVRSNGLSFVYILLSFLALVWIDSAVFAIIQESPQLKALTWGSSEQKLLIGGVHLLAALVAGRLLDRGLLRELLLAALALFAVAFHCLGLAGWPQQIAAALYATGISFYSVGLIFYPASAASEQSARWRAALLFGVAGWLGSGLGVGMAQELGTIPGWFIVVAGVILMLAWLTSERGRLARVGSLFGTSALLVVAASAMAALEDGEQNRSGELLGSVARGRQVYLAEGCINCHSQYVRCGTRDEEMWGPCGAPDAVESPPLIGNRRLGPDLLNVGNRRSRSWQRLHLEQPRQLSPGSMMPSYRHLFADHRGDALVSFLSSLGADTGEQRFAMTEAQPVPDHGAGGSVAGGERLFAQHCSACHGSRGRGDGELSQQLAVRRPTAIDLSKGDFWFASHGPLRGSEAEGLARLIRYGVPGTSMPGHEYFSAAEVADLVAFVFELSAPGSAP